MGRGAASAGVVGEAVGMVVGDAVGNELGVVIIVGVTPVVDVGAPGAAADAPVVAVPDDAVAPDVDAGVAVAVVAAEDDDGAAGGGACSVI